MTLVTCAFLCDILYLFYSMTSNTIELRSMYLADLRTGELNGDDTACAKGEYLLECSVLLYPKAGAFPQNLLPSLNWSLTMCFVQ